MQFPLPVRPAMRTRSVEVRCQLNPDLGQPQRQHMGSSRSGTPRHRPSCPAGRRVPWSRHRWTGTPAWTPIDPRDSKDRVRPRYCAARSGLPRTRRDCLSGRHAPSVLESLAGNTQTRMTSDRLPERSRREPAAWLHVEDCRRLPVLPREAPYLWVKSSRVVGRLIERRGQPRHGGFQLPNPIAARSVVGHLGLDESPGQYGGDAAEHRYSDDHQQHADESSLGSDREPVPVARRGDRGGRPPHRRATTGECWLHPSRRAGGASGPRPPQCAGRLPDGG